MPCYDPPIRDDFATNHDLRVVRDRLRKVEAMLCSIMGGLDREGLLQAIIEKTQPDIAGVSADDIRLWYSRHRQRDYKKDL